MIEDGALLKRFKIVSLVGIGNYAKVYKAIPSSSPLSSKIVSKCPKEFAIKSINLSKVSENYRTKFLPRELSILKRIQHANICKIYEIFQVSDRIFIVMQFCPNGTIADLLQKIGPLSESVSRHLFTQVVDAVVYLHSAELAHRDIKLENILLDDNCVPKLTDFSYSIRLGRSRSTNSKRKNQTSNTSIALQPPPSGPPKMRLNDTFCGTLPYLPPEMIRQIPYDSKKTDIWSLGVCLYVMLNDKIPFPIDDVKLMVKKQMNRDYKFKTTVKVSDKCLELVGQLMEPDFMKRINVLEASKHQWMSGPRDKPEI